MRRSRFGKFAVPAMAAGVMLAATAVVGSQAKEMHPTPARVEGTKITQVGNVPVKNGKSQGRLTRPLLDPVG